MQSVHTDNKAHECSSMTTEQREDRGGEGVSKQGGGRGGWSDDEERRVRGQERKRKRKANSRPGERKRGKEKA